FVSEGKRNRPRDYHEKRTEYLAAGVREYWINDRFARTLTACRSDKPGRGDPPRRNLSDAFAPGLRPSPGQAARGRRSLEGEQGKLTREVKFSRDFIWAPAPDPWSSAATAPMRHLSSRRRPPWSRRQEVPTPADRRVRRRSRCGARAGSRPRR